MILNCNTISCLNGGVCLYNSNGKPFCECTNQYQGIYCQTPVQNSCSNSRSNLCNNLINVGCSKINCKNNGYCHLDSFNKPYCICQNAFKGIYCQLCTFFAIHFFLEQNL
jgi:hypothetical protein